MQRKIIKIGSSAAVILPKEVLHERKLKVGDFVNVTISKDGGDEANVAIDPRIVQWTDKFIEENRSLLKKLAKS
ncbi:MAG: AbrB/MazE/SpoVT family DNA-binding domain-containing protein [Patescibacteria group bacterium]|nr:AbrB/MazE/SpoVT family DNA-binding domain-containing protein [Patescibacteria group bacterium]